MFLKYTLAFIIAFTTIVVKAQSFDMSGKDTINAMDINNLKQGKWVIKNSTKT